MTEKAKNLSSGLEDYVEAIYIAHLNNKPLKGAELARQLNISRASVSEALAKLVAKNLIKYNSYEAISITKEGIEEAKKVYEKHHTLEQFFETVLGITKSEASENAMPKITCFFISITFIFLNAAKIEKLFVLSGFQSTKK